MLFRFLKIVLMGLIIALAIHPLIFIQATRADYAQEPFRLPVQQVSADYTTPNGVTLYRLAFTDNRSPEDYASMLPDPGNHPVIFMFYGLNNDINSMGGYRGSADWFNDTYCQVPRDLQPIIIGVDWDSDYYPGETIMDAISFGDHERDAEVAGQTVAYIINAYQSRYPDVQVSFIAHSLGNRVALQAIQNLEDMRSAASIRGYLAIQAAVGVEEVRPYGRFSAVFNGSRVHNVLATWSGEDSTLRYMYNSYLSVNNAAGDRAVGTVVTVSFRGSGGIADAESYSHMANQDIAGEHRSININSDRCTNPEAYNNLVFAVRILFDFLVGPGNPFAPIAVNFKSKRGIE